MSALADNLANQVMTRCDELATCSEDADRITRRYLTPPMKAVHDRMKAWMTEAGLASRVDNAGNVIGRRPSAGGQQVLLLGSHLDSVPGAGRYDGVLGVLLGLAVAEVVRDDDLPFHIDIVGFSEEEGERFSLPYLGSSALTGTFDPDWLERVDKSGSSMREAIAQFQLDADLIPEASYSPDDVIAYVEPHLEQGPMLEQADLPLGVVTGIAGQSRLQIEFNGIAGHAGTTPMLGRCDALVMASEFVGEVSAIGRQTAGLRATVGRIAVEPSAPNVIPGRVELSLDVRHMEDLVRERALNDLLATGKRIADAAKGSFSLLDLNAQSAAVMNQHVSDLLTQSVGACGYEPMELFSGAGHDAVIISKRFPTAMLFLRHPGGVSHHPDERVDREDVAVAIDVLCQFVRKLAEQYEHKPVSSN